MGISPLVLGPVYIGNTAKPAPMSKNIFNAVEWFASVPVFVSNKYNGAFDRVEPMADGRSRMLNVLVKIALAGVFAYVEVSRVFIASAYLAFFAVRSVARWNVQTLFTFRKQSEVKEKQSDVEQISPQERRRILDSLRGEFCDTLERDLVPPRDGQERYELQGVDPLAPEAGASSMVTFVNGSTLLMGGVCPILQDGSLRLFDRTLVKPDAFMSVVGRRREGALLPHDRFDVRDDHPYVHFFDPSVVAPPGRCPAEFFYEDGGSDRIKDSVRFMVKCLVDGRKLYVNCQSGKDRSFALLIAAMLYLAGDTSDETYEKVAQFALSKRLLGNGDCLVRSFDVPFQEVLKEVQDKLGEQELQAEGLSGQIEELYRRVCFRFQEQLYQLQTKLGMEKGLMGGLITRTLREIDAKLQTRSDLENDRDEVEMLFNLRRLVDSFKGSFEAYHNYQRWYVLPVRAAVAELLQEEHEADVVKNLDEAFAQVEEV